MWYHLLRVLARGRGSGGRAAGDASLPLLPDGGDPEEPTDGGSADEDGDSDAVEGSGDAVEGGDSDAVEGGDSDAVEGGDSDAVEGSGGDSNAVEGSGGDASEDDAVPSGKPVDESNVEVTDAGEAEPVDPKWRKPDPEDIPEFEVRADEPVVSGGTGIGDESATPDDEAPDDPTAGMPNTARAPGATRISTDGTEAYVAAMELCARLPDDVRLPEEAADLVPAAVEAELEQDVQQFAATEFGAERPHVDVLDFVDVDGEIWLRLRIGLPATDFDDLDPEAIRSYALEQLEGVL